MKYLKKINFLVLIVILLVVNFATPKQEVQAKTLRDLKAELEDAINRYNSGQSEKALTEQQIESKRERVRNINEEIDKTQKEISDLSKEIEELEKDIEEKEKEIKQIINYYQLSSGESIYLEYAFKAADFTDFIYRLAVSEQLSSYNDRLIDEYNAKIKENEQKQKELNQKTIDLNNKQNELEKEIRDLGSHLSEVMEINVSVEDEIKSLRELIDTYENVHHCKLDDDLDVCILDQLPPGTAFYRPVVSAYISSDYGARTYYLNGKLVSDFHYGVDFAGTGHGANVYSIASGRVAWITRKSSCGGNMVYIHHTVNGKEYTSGYFHLASINVSVGDVVTKDTVIGAVGGNPRIETWDGCSNGTHLHLQMATTHIEARDGFYTRFLARRIDPMSVVNMPTYGNSFSNRTTKY